MSFAARTFSKNEAIKALAWIKKQNYPDKEIKDIQVVLELYRNSQKPHAKVNFIEQLNQFSPDQIKVKSTNSFELDPKSLNTVKEAAKYLNISQEKDALNLLIQIGFNHLKRNF